MTNDDTTQDYRTYLGDEVYASYDGYHVWLTVDDGVSVTERVALEPAVWARLMKWKETLDAGSAERHAALLAEMREREAEITDTEETS